MGPNCAILAIKAKFKQQHRVSAKIKSPAIMALLNKLITYITSVILLLSPGNTFIEGVVGQPRSFFPSQLEIQTDKTISQLIYRGLFKYDIYGELIPDLAEGWEVSEDGLVYTVTLKGNQHWIDGTEVTSNDLIYT